MRILKIVLVGVALSSLWSLPAFAADNQYVKKNSTAPAPAQAGNANTNYDAEQVNVDSIKEKYWARGDETEVGVVQNRTYSKKGRLEFTLTGGVLYSDPFLSVQTVGGDIGYHLSEYISFHIVGFKDLVGPSSALSTFQSTEGATTDTNPPNYYLGGEMMASLLYGKLSVVGQSIIYYDFYMMAGGGATNTLTGTYATPSVGLGQRFYLSRVLSLRLDYHLMYYRETIDEEVVPTEIGQSRGQRNNWNNVINLGISFMPFGGKL